MRSPRICVPGLVLPAYQIIGSHKRKKAPPKRSLLSINVNLSALEADTMLRAISRRCVPQRPGSCRQAFGAEVEDVASAWRQPGVIAEVIFRISVAGVLNRTHSAASHLHQAVRIHHY